MSRRLAPISTEALKAMQAERQNRIVAIQAELREIEQELAKRTTQTRPQLKLVRQEGS